jgi:hypothetical protein
MDLPADPPDRIAEILRELIALCGNKEVSSPSADQSDATASKVEETEFEADDTKPDQTQPL